MKWGSGQMLMWTVSLENLTLLELRQKQKKKCKVNLQKFTLDQNMKNSSFRLLLLLFGLSLIFVPTSACLNDTRCANCNAYYLLIGLSVFLYYNCDQCIPNAGLNTGTNLCECMNGFYPHNATSCMKCSPICATCSNESTCTSCYSQQKRTLSQDTCICAEGYQSKNNEAVCKQKPNVLMIVLSTIGSAVCMVLGFIICAFIRMRRGAQQIHAQTKKHKNRGNAQIQIHCADYENQQNNSGMFWYSKSIPYKEGEICSICLDSNPLFMTECGHYFHPKCIYDWLSTKTTCPNCNKQTEQKSVRRWCQKCRKVLMPVIMNITIKRQSSSKRKRQIVQACPVEVQLCDNCENESMSQDAFQTIEKQPMSADHNLSHSDQL